MQPYQYGETGTSSMAVAMKTEERESIVKEFEWAITDLQKVHDELLNRLGPVLQPSLPEQSDKVEHDVGPISDVRSRLHDLHATTASLRRIVSRLEV